MSPIDISNMAEVKDLTALAYREPPAPYTEAQVTNRFWSPDPFDAHIPATPSFITDLVLMTRGTQAPSQFSVWSALTMISAVLRRTAWLEWPFSRFYANLYTLLIAIPALCGKSTIIDSIVDPILKRFHRYMPDTNRVRLSELSIFRDKITPEALYLALEEKSVSISLKTGHRIVNLGGQICIIASDLPTLLGKQTYNEGLLANLTRLYDCPDQWEYLKVSEGRKLTRTKTYTTLLAGITPHSMARMIPEEALGGGFMSRIIPVPAVPTRGYDEIIQVHGGPDSTEMQRRLAWILSNTVGEYVLHPKAKAVFKDWHDTYWTKAAADPEAYGHTRSRMRVMVRKVSLLLRAARYEPAKAGGGENIVSEEDMRNSIALVDATFDMAETTLAQVGESEYETDLRKVERVIEREKRCKIGDVTRATKIRKKGTLLVQMIQQLYIEGKIAAYVAGTPQSRVTGLPGEEYVWVNNSRRKLS